MGAKYTIEVEDKPFELLSKDGFTSEKLYRVKGFNSLVFDWNGLNKLTPYPDLEQVRKEAYEKGWKEAENHYEEGYNDGYDTGLSHAWEAVRKVVALSTVDRREIFGSEYMYTILEKHTASEAIEKIRQHEQEKEEIKVGDEVKSIESDWTAIVTKSEEGHLTLMGDSGAIANGYDAKYFAKTGRHFPEIAEVLRKMRGDAT